MGFPAPRFDYASLATPGGIGQGLASLGGALADASARRRQAEVEQAKLEFEKQGLARLEARDIANRSQQAMQFQEQANHNRAQEEYQQGQLKHQEGLAALANTRYNDGVTRQNAIDDEAMIQKGADNARQWKLDKANIGLKNAQTQAALAPKAPSTARDPFALRPDVYVHGAKVAAQKARERVDALIMSPKHQQELTKSKAFWSPGPAPVDPEASYQTYFEEEMGRLGLPAQAPKWTTGAAPTATDTAATARASLLRSRFEGMYPDGLPPEVELSLTEAKGGDQASAAQLERMLQEYDAQEDDVAPDEEYDLLGNPR